jgi:hypothetical protein
MQAAHTAARMKLTTTDRGAARGALLERCGMCYTCALIPQEFHITATDASTAPQPVLKHHLLPMSTRLVPL